MLTQQIYRRPDFGRGNGILRLLTPADFRWEPWQGLGQMSVTRASTATQNVEQVEPAYAYLAGGSLAGVTFTRASEANQTKEMTG